MSWRVGVIGLICLVVCVAHDARAEPPTVSVLAAPMATMPNEYFRLTVTFADADGDPLEAWVENAPPWTTTWSTQYAGRGYLLLTGVPIPGQEGLYDNVRVSVSDGQTITTTQPMQIAVGIPSIEMLTTNVMALPNSYFSAIAAIYHPGHLPLEIVVDNAPPWLATWSYYSAPNYYVVLYGTPTPQDIGVNPDTRIRASDGMVTATHALDLVVPRVTDSALTVSWLPPTQNEDGSLLADLTGYRMYVWPPEGGAPLSQWLDVSYGTSVPLAGLPTGLWKIAMSAYNSAGAESRLSAVLPVLVQETAP
jgi:hypothetical protein